jgi:hypothetical protein
VADSYGKLVTGIKPPASELTEWFSVPADHKFQGYVRITNIGVAATYRIAGVTGTGVSVTSKDYEVYDTELRVGDIHDLTMDLNELETLVVWASTVNVTFNFRGLDIDAV